MKFGDTGSNLLGTLIKRKRKSMEMTSKEFWQQCVLVQLANHTTSPHPGTVTDIATKLMSKMEETFDNLDNVPISLTNGEKLDVQNGRKIIAIKSLRNRFLGLSLADAKKICDQYQIQFQNEMSNIWKGPVGGNNE
jgi:hypothetical protein